MLDFSLIEFRKKLISQSPLLYYYALIYFVSFSEFLCAVCCVGFLNLRKSSSWKCRTVLTKPYVFGWMCDKWFRNINLLGKDSEFKIFPHKTAI